MYVLGVTYLQANMLGRTTSSRPKHLAFYILHRYETCDGVYLYTITYHQYKCKPATLAVVPKNGEQNVYLISVAGMNINLAFIEL